LAGLSTGKSNPWLRCPVSTVRGGALIVASSLIALPAAADAADARRLAQRHGFERVAIDAGRFELAGFLKGRKQPGDTLVVVIEGDGYAFRGSRQPSGDPTPRDAVGLEIAAAEPSDKVLALARPCQYQRKPRRPECTDPRWWTTHRFAPEVIEAASRAIDIVKVETAATRIFLVGWSGGGVLAALLAADRRDVAGLVTVAAPLYLGAWTRHHRVSPMPESRDPVAAVAALAAMPQAHLAGKRDEVVPPAIVGAFVDRLPPGAPAKFIAADVDHRCCWAEKWQALRPTPPLPPR